MERNIIVCGIGTDVGKTIVSAVLVEALQADYWKPVQCGNLEKSDTQVVKKLVSNSQSTFHSESYRFSHSLAPHYAAQLEKVAIDPAKIQLPTTSQRLVIEGAGGVMVPLNKQNLLTDKFESWNADWIIVSSHYIGSINHTLLSIEYLKQRRLPLKGIIFNGIENSNQEKMILHYTQLPCLGRLLPEPFLTKSIIRRYADQWRAHL